jgi:hypothetical protein
MATLNDDSIAHRIVRNENWSCVTSIPIDRRTFKDLTIPTNPQNARARTNPVHVAQRFASRICQVLSQERELAQTD